MSIVISLFPSLFYKFFPAYLYIVGGYTLKRWFYISQIPIAKILFYVLLPLVIFRAALFSDIKDFLILSSVSFFASLFIAFFAQFFRKFFASLMPKGVLECIFSYFNIAWFGIPMVIPFYGEQGMTIMSAFFVGGIIFGNTIGFFLILNGQRRENPFIALLKLPTFHCIAIAFLLHLFDFREILIHSQFLKLAFDMLLVVTYILGIGFLGMGIASVTYDDIKKHKKELIAILSLRFLVSSIIIGIIGLMGLIFGFLEAIEFKVLLFIPLLPVAANILVLTSAAKIKDNFVTLVLFSSTLLSCVLFIALIALWK